MASSSQQRDPNYHMVYTDMYNITCELFIRCSEINGTFSVMCSEHSARLSELRNALTELTNLLTDLRNRFHEVSSQAHEMLAEVDPNPPVALTSTQINSLPQSRIGKSQDSLTCAICLANVKRTTLLRELPCGHKYHPRCIAKWLRQTATCPTCRAVVVTNRSDVATQN